MQNKTAILPQPDTIALEYSLKLQNLIKQEIVHSGPMSFARFMELALYAPGCGYYSAGSKKLGREGDFVTAPEMSDLFSFCVANQCAQILTQIGGDILEFGAGSGKMAGMILTELERLHILPDHYYILEVSADLRQRQQLYLQTNFPQYVSRIIWLDSLPENFKGVCLANEVLDAFPINRFKKTEQGFQELCVDDRNDKFVYSYQEPSLILKQYLETLPVLSDEYESECNLNIEGWLKALAGVINQGVVLLIDYGFPAHEYYHPDRNKGTFMCHYHHQGHDDALINIGLQDMTAHVDFTAVISAAVKAGFSLSGYTNQASFLLSCGITEYLQKFDGQDHYLALAAEAKVLTLPSEMGELFKVMALNKNVDLNLKGFLLRDYSHKL